MNEVREGLYKIVREPAPTFDDQPESFWSIARSVIDDGYIVALDVYGRAELLQEFQNHGIKPQKSPKGGDVCCIGFSEKEQKWYGWSHRAMCGFTIGSEVKKGHCAFVPSNFNEAVEDAIAFWSDEDKSDVRCVGIKVEPNGGYILEIAWTYGNGIPNEKLRNQISGVEHYVPPFGRGEWVAETLEDAKQMAIDFAEGVG